MKLLLVQPDLALSTGEENLERVRAAIAEVRESFEDGDIVLLPEHWDPDVDGARHQARVATLARELGCHVVGGSHHRDRGQDRVNTGCVAAPDGSVIAHYDKLRPYATERELVSPGTRLGEVTIGGRRILILVCADFWFADLIARASDLPDLILVPALSVSRKPSPDYSRSLWRHLAVARAYELGTYVGVSDWSCASTLPMLSASGVAGFADPTVSQPEDFYTPVGAHAKVFTPDFDALDAFRDDRRGRGFFWK